MERISSTVSELFQTGKMPSEIFKILKPHVSRSGVYKILKHLSETGSAHPNVRFTLNQKTTQPYQEHLRKNQEKSKEKHKKIGFSSKCQLWYWVQISGMV